MESARLDAAATVTDWVQLVLSAMAQCNAVAGVVVAVGFHVGTQLFEVVED